MPTYDPATNPFDPGDDFPSTDASVTLPSGVDAVFSDYSYTVEVGITSLIMESWSGKEKRSAKVPERRTFKLTFDQLTDTDADTLWNHYLAQEGTLTAFSYYDYLSGEQFTVRYAKNAMSRETFLYEAEKVGLELVEVL